MRKNKRRRIKYAVTQPDQLAKFPLRSYNKYMPGEKTFSPVDRMIMRAAPLKVLEDLFMKLFKSEYI